ncbi:ABC transporter ATP-binding protein [Planctomycetota bacterium]
MPEPILKITALSKIYRRENNEITPLSGINLSVNEGEFLSLMGPSGSGKTTLLNIIAGIDCPTSGSVLVNGQDIAKLSDNDLATWRNRNIGYIFQLYNLIPVLTAYENVELPLLLLPLSGKDRRKHVETALEATGIADRAGHYPRQLSGGQEQRVAIARAIVTDPRIIVADEPTGDLDAKAEEEILELLQQLNTSFNKTIIMVTHNPEAAGIAGRRIHLDKGVIKEENIPAKENMT